MLQRRAGAYIVDFRTTRCTRQTIQVDSIMSQESSLFAIERPGDSTAAWNISNGRKWWAATHQNIYKNPPSINRRRYYLFYWYIQYDMAFAFKEFLMAEWLKSLVLLLGQCLWLLRIPPIINCLIYSISVVHNVMDWCIFQTQISQFADRSRKTLTAEPRDWRAKWNVMSSPNRAPRASVGPSTAPASWWRLRQDIGRRPTGPSPSCATHLAANSISGLCSAGPQILWAPSRSHASTTFTQPVTIITIPFLFIPTTRFDYRNISI